jgi:hypothetical protein
MHEVGFIFLSHGLHPQWHLTNLLAKTSPVEVEALKAQVELLKLSLEATTQASKQMADSFKDYVSAIQVCFGLLGLGTAVLSGVATFLYGKSLNEATQAMDTEVSRQIKEKISGRISSLEKIIDREDIINQVSVEYLTHPKTQNNELRLLKARGFDVKLNALEFNALDRLNIDRDILIFDLVNSNIEDKEGLVHKVSQKISNQKSAKPIVVIYVKDQLKKIREIPDNVYYLSANSKATLVGAVVNAANTSSAIRRLSQEL